MLPACCHQLAAAAATCLASGVLPGDLDKDAFAPRLFVDNGLEVMVAQSYSKNLGLYGERVGALNVVLSDADVSDDCVCVCYTALVLWLHPCGASWWWCAADAASLACSSWFQHPLGLFWCCFCVCCVCLCVSLLTCRLSW